MKEQQFSPGWDNERVQRVLAQYESTSEEAQIAEDEQAAQEQAGQTVISVPSELLPAIRSLLAAHDRMAST
jgi:hypothetical protein